MHNIDISLQNPKLLSFLFSIVFLISLLIITFLPIVILWKIFLLFFCISYGSYSLILQHKKSITRIKRDGKNWIIEDEEKNYLAELCGSSTITRFFCVLRFKLTGQKFSRSIVIFKYTIPENKYRRLLIHMAHQ